MPQLTSTQSNLIINVAAGNSLRIYSKSGTPTVTGSTVSVEDATSTLGCYVYGPQTSAATITLSTTGVLEYDVVAGDPTPARTLTINPTTGTIDDPVAAGAVAKAAWQTSASVPSVMLGDSYAGNSDRGYQVASTSVTGGVATIVVSSSVISAANRLIYPGCLVSTSGYDNETMCLSRAPVLSVNGAANSFTVACPGVPDGTPTTTTIAGFAMIQNHSAPADVGLPVWLNRLGRGAFNFLHNAGRPGYRLREILTQAQWDKRVKPYAPKLVPFWGGYNDLNQISLDTAGYSADTMLADLAAGLAIATKGGALLAVFSLVHPGAFTGAGTAAALNAMVKYNAKAKIMVEAAGHAWINIYPYTVTDAGAQRGGLFQTDLIHPAAELARIAAASMLAHPRVAALVAPRRLADGYYDNVSVAGTSSTNIVRAAPVAGSTSGSVGGVTTAAGGVPSGASGAQGVSAGYTCAASGSAGAAWTSTDPDTGLGAQWVNAIPTASGQSSRITYTLTTADIVPGSTLYLAAKLWLTTAHNASNKSPNGQNVISAALRLQLAIDGQQYTFYSANGGLTNNPAADLVGITEVFDGLVLPSGASCTAAQVDYFVQFGGAGNVYMGMAQPTVRTTIGL